MTDAAPEQEFPRIEPDEEVVEEVVEELVDEQPEEQVDEGPYTWPTGKVDPVKRIVAVIIDAALAVVVGLIPIIGGIIATAYWVLRDGMDLNFMDQRSVGKKLTNLRPLNADGSRLDMMGSVRRNWMFGIGGLVQILLFIPILGWLLILPVGLVALGFGVVELVMVLTDAEGRRFGDRWGGTKVVEAEE